METDNKLCFMGEKPVLKNSVIENMGENNILFCEKNVVLVNSKIDFRGSDSLIYLSSSRCEYKLNIAIHNQQVCFWGRDNYINGIVNVILSEQKHIFIGSDNLFSLGIWMRNADPHLIYDSETKERVNSTQSIYRRSCMDWAVSHDTKRIEDWFREYRRCNESCVGKYDSF